jgi:hypothetical protein
MEFELKSLRSSERKVRVNSNFEVRDCMPEISGTNPVSPAPVAQSQQCLDPKNWLRVSNATTTHALDRAATVTGVIKSTVLDI